VVRILENAFFDPATAGEGGGEMYCALCSRF
jgi:hypothetical protein